MLDFYWLVEYAHGSSQPVEARGTARAKPACGWPGTVRSPPGPVSNSAKRLVLYRFSVSLASPLPTAAMSTRRTATAEPSLGGELAPADERPVGASRWAHVAFQGQRCTHVLSVSERPRVCPLCWNTPSACKNGVTAAVFKINRWSLLFCVPIFLTPLQLLSARASKPGVSVRAPGSRVSGPRGQGPVAGAQAWACSSRLQGEPAGLAAAPGKKESPSAGLLPRAPPAPPLGWPTARP